MHEGTIHWGNASQDIRSFVDNFVGYIGNIMAERFVGAYLHGSLAMGGFHPASSDIDVLVVTNTPLTATMERQILEYCLDMSRNPFPIEISIVQQKHLLPWHFPTPYEFHFSESWRKSFEEQLTNGGIEPRRTLRTDIDLAAHVTIIRYRGVALEGPSIDEVFPHVPKQDYLAALMEDLQYIGNHLMIKPIYCILNLCRITAYLTDDIVCSKVEGGEWALQSMSSAYTPLIESTLYAYRSGHDMHVEGESIQPFVRHALARIDQLLYNA